MSISSGHGFCLRVSGCAVSPQSLLIRERQRLSFEEEEHKVLPPQNILLTTKSWKQHCKLLPCLLGFSEKVASSFESKAWNTENWWRLMVPSEQTFSLQYLRLENRNLSVMSTFLTISVLNLKSIVTIFSLCFPVFCDSVGQRLGCRPPSGMKSCNPISRLSQKQ